LALRVGQLAADERGVTSVIAMLILMPLLFLFVMLGVQAAVAARTNQVAAHAAQEGAREARTRNGSIAAGRAEALRVLRVLSPGVLQEPRVNVSGSRTGDTIRVEVAGYAQSVVPGLRPRVHQVSVGKVEKFRGPDQ
jgi:TadE-like protein